MIFLCQAFRNARRNVWRSAITVLELSVGTAALLFLWAFIDGVAEQMIENSTRYLTTHVQIHRTGFQREPSPGLTLEDDAQLIRTIRSLGAPHVRVSRRLEGNALASFGDKSRGVDVLGIDPQTESEVTTLNKTVQEGRFLTREDHQGAIIGARIAEALGIHVGDEIVLVTQGVDGSPGAGKYRVTGIFRTKMDAFDSSLVLLPLAAAQALFATGDQVTSLVVRLPERGAAPSLRSALERRLGNTHEVLGWETLLPPVRQAITIHRIVGMVLVVVTFMIIAAGVANTVLMNVMERTREFGLMMALGASPAQIMRVVLYEASVLGLAGVASGVLIGLIFIQYFAHRGIHLESYVSAVETMHGLDPVIFPMLSWSRGSLVAAALWLMVMCAALYPAWRAARLSPVEALRNAPDSPSLGRRTASFVRVRLPLGCLLALRNIHRHPRRTLLTMGASAIGVAGFIFLISLAHGFVTDLIDNSTGYIVGHVQIQHARFRTDMEPRHRLSSPASRLATIRSRPEVAAAAPRVQVMALAANSGQSLNFMLVGIDPDAERGVTRVHQVIHSGRPLAATDTHGIMIGRRLAERLALSTGDKIVVMAQAIDGGIATAAYRVVGVFSTGSDAFDARIGFITLPSAQTLLGMQQDVSTITIRLHDSQDAPAVQAALQFAEGNDEVVAISWQSLLPELDQMAGYFSVSLQLIIGIVLTVVAIGIMNTMLMSVMERTRELGILMAIGMRPSQVLLIILLEALLLTSAGIVGGIALGVPLVEWLHATGWDLTAFAQAGQSIPGLTGMIHPMFVGIAIVKPAGFLLVMSLLAAGYPAWRAARLSPPTAIHHA